MATPSVVEHSEGGNFIPPTQRPDGTWRKPRRVKEGYVPQEEVPLYESRGKQWAKSRSAYPVGLDPELIKASELKLTAKTNAGGVSGTSSKKKKKGSSNQPVPNPGAFDDYDIPQQPSIKSSPPSANANMNKQTTTTNNVKKQQESSIISSQQNKDKTSSKKTKESTIDEQQLLQQSNNSTEPIKRLRNLRKKLRDIECLERKIESKELKNPDKDQLEKVSRKGDVQEEILALQLQLNEVNIKDTS